MKTLDKMQEAYRKAVIKHAGVLGVVEDVVRFSSLIAPGTLKESEITTEALSAALNLLGMYNDRIIQNSKSTETQVGMKDGTEASLRHTNGNFPGAASSSSTMSRGQKLKYPQSQKPDCFPEAPAETVSTQTWITAVQQVEVLIEMLAEKHFEEGKWFFVFLVETIKALIRLRALRRQNGGLVVSQSAWEDAQASSILPSRKHSNSNSNSSLNFARTSRSNPPLAPHPSRLSSIHGPTPPASNDGPPTLTPTEHPRDLQSHAKPSMPNFCLQPETHPFPHNHRDVLCRQWDGPCRPTRPDEPCSCPSRQRLNGHARAVPSWSEPEPERPSDPGPARDVAWRGTRSGRIHPSLASMTSRPDPPSTVVAGHRYAGASSLEPELLQGAPSSRDGPQVALAEGRLTSRDSPHHHHHHHHQQGVTSTKGPALADVTSPNGWVGRRSGRVQASLAYTLGGDVGDVGAPTPTPTALARGHPTPTPTPTLPRAPRLWPGPSLEPRAVMSPTPPLGLTTQPGPERGQGPSGENGHAPAGVGIGVGAGTGASPRPGQALRTAGEVLYITRPLLYVGSIYFLGYGRRSWRPWLLSLSIDGLAQYLLRFGTSLSPPQREEIKTRRYLLAYYLFRSPFFDAATRHPLEAVSRTFHSLPVVGALSERLVDIVAALQSLYFYTAAT